jgi:sec-independent protein translocase protein TatB
MFDLGWAEMAVIMLVALIVIGPKDLPKVARTIGQWTGKARALARDFQRSLDDMAREAELDEIKKSIDRAGSGGLKRAIKDAVDPDDELEKAFDVEDRASRATLAKPAAMRPLPPAKATDAPKAAPAEPAIAPPSGDGPSLPGSAEKFPAEQAAVQAGGGKSAP